jgi:hypothetical protein
LYEIIEIIEILEIMAILVLSTLWIRGWEGPRGGRNAVAKTLKK